MKLLVIGGTGLIGSKLVEQLRRDGHDAVTDEGLPGALEGARVVVDVSNAPTSDDAALLGSFQTSSRDMLAAEAAAGVGHHVTLSVVGADRLPGSGYLRAKVAQEDAVKAGPVPYTIVRATQLFESVGRVAAASSVPALLQPVAADDVATTLADVAVGSPLNDTIELAGPEAFRLDVDARRLGAKLDDRSLTPADDARIATTRFQDWLGQSPTSTTERRAARCSPPSFSSTAPSPSPRAGTPSSIRWSKPATR
jgi:uncharacterized protein YbjT (DUF2867 family)